MFFAVYKVSSGEVKQTVSAPFYIPEMFVLDNGFDVVEIPREANDTTEYIKDGVLTDKPQSMIDTTTP